MSIVDSESIVVRVGVVETEIESVVVAVACQEILGRIRRRVGVVVKTAEGLVMIVRIVVILQWCKAETLRGSGKCIDQAHDGDGEGDDEKSEGRDHSEQQNLSASLDFFWI